MVQKISIVFFLSLVFVAYADPETLNMKKALSPALQKKVDEKREALKRTRSTSDFSLEKRELLHRTTSLPSLNLAEKKEQMKRRVQEEEKNKNLKMITDSFKLFWQKVPSKYSVESYQRQEELYEKTIDTLYDFLNSKEESYKYAIKNELQKKEDQKNNLAHFACQKASPSLMQFIVEYKIDLFFEQNSEQLYPMQLLENVLAYGIFEKYFKSNIQQIYLLLPGIQQKWYEEHGNEVNQNFDAVIKNIGRYSFLNDDNLEEQDQEARDLYRKEQHAKQQEALRKHSPKAQIMTEAELVPAQEKSSWYSRLTQMVTGTIDAFGDAITLQQSFDVLGEEPAEINNSADLQNQERRIRTALAFFESRWKKVQSDPHSKKFFVQKIKNYRYLETGETLVHRACQKVSPSLLQFLIQLEDEPDKEWFLQLNKKEEVPFVLIPEYKGPKSNLVDLTYEKFYELSSDLLFGKQGIIKTDGDVKKHEEKIRTLQNKLEVELKKEGNEGKEKIKKLKEKIETAKKERNTTFKEKLGRYRLEERKEPASEKESQVNFTQAYAALFNKPSEQAMTSSSYQEQEKEISRFVEHIKQQGAILLPGDEKKVSNIREDAQNFNEFLLKYRDKKTEDTVAHFACKRASLAYMSYVFEKFPELFKVKNQKGQTPLLCLPLFKTELTQKAFDRTGWFEGQEDVAANKQYMTEQVDGLNELIQKILQKYPDLVNTNHQGSTLVYQSIADNNKVLFDFLLKQENLDLESIFNQNMEDGGNTCFHKAVALYNMDIVQALHEKAKTVENFNGLKNRKNSASESIADVIAANLDKHFAWFLKEREHALQAVFDLYYGQKQALKKKDNEGRSQEFVGDVVGQAKMRFLLQDKISNKENVNPGDTVFDLVQSSIDAGVFGYVAVFDKEQMKEIIKSDENNARKESLLRGEQ